MLVLRTPPRMDVPWGWHTMFNKQQVQQLLGSTVHDGSGAKVGKVEQVYLDDNTDQPEWVTVRTGTFGRRESFVPLESANLDENGLNVPVDKEAISHAPQIEAGQQLSPEREAELYRHYQIDPAHGRSAEQDKQTAGRAGQDRSGAPTAGPVIGSRPRTAGSADQDVSGSPTQERQTESAGAGVGAAASGTADTRRQPMASAGTATAGTRSGAAATGTGSQNPAGSGAQAQSAGASGTQASQRSAAASQDNAMTRSEERLDVGTEQVETGRVRLRKYTVTEQVHTTVPVSHEEVRIEREPIAEGDRASMSSEMTDEAQEHELVLHAERPVVHKHTEPVERVRLGTEIVREEASIDEELRKERIDVDRDGEATDDPTGRHER